MGMRIISGLARGVELEVPPGESVRPTAVRSRKALFDSLGDLSGVTVLDLCAGSGALALEAVSRGAARAVMVEREARHRRVIEGNLRRVTAAGVTAELRVVAADAVMVDGYAAAAAGCGLIFADPPYAESLRIFSTLMSEPRFFAAFPGALVVWEMPGTPGVLGEFLAAARLTGVRTRKFGGVDFLMGVIDG